MPNSVTGHAVYSWEPPLVTDSEHLHDLARAVSVDLHLDLARAVDVGPHPDSDSEVAADHRPAVEPAVVVDLHPA